MAKNIKRIAVFTSGGDAPGMNAAIRAVVRTGVYHDLHVYGIERGYQGMIDGKFTRLEPSHVGNIIQRGGTMLRTARSKEFMTPEGRAKAYDNLVAYDIDACVAIGGNGTFTGAHVFAQEYDIPFVGLPGTIDNDLYGTDLTRFRYGD
jgi:6-phosphofructokinase 1